MTNTVIDENGEVTITGSVLDSGLSPISNRVYREEDLKRMVAEFNAGDMPHFGEMMATGSDNYGTTVNMDRISHKVERVWFEDGSIMAEMKVLGTPHGDILREIITKGAMEGVSSVGFKPTPVMTGTLETIDEDLTVIDPTLIRVDATPEI
jgi:hypothetical protein